MVVELRRPIKPKGLEKPEPSPAPTADSEKAAPIMDKPAAERIKPAMITPRHKPKPAPKPPTSVEEWIDRASADGPPTAAPPTLKYLTVSLDAETLGRLEGLAIDASLNKLSLFTKLVQDASARGEEIRAFGRTFADPPGPVHIRTFLLPADVFAAASALPKQLRVFGRSRAIRLLIAYFARRAEIL